MTPGRCGFGPGEATTREHDERERVAAWLDANGAHALARAIRGGEHHRPSGSSCNCTWSREVFRKAHTVLGGMTSGLSSELDLHRATCPRSGQ
jgi:hypothetical protein